MAINLFKGKGKREKEHLILAYLFAIIAVITCFLEIYAATTVSVLLGLIELWVASIVGAIEQVTKAIKRED